MYTLSLQIPSRRIFSFTTFDYYYYFTYNTYLVQFTKHKKVQNRVGLNGHHKSHSRPSEKRATISAVPLHKQRHQSRPMTFRRAHAPSSSRIARGYDGTRPPGAVCGTQLTPRWAQISTLQGPCNASIIIYFLSRPRNSTPATHLIRIQWLGYKGRCLVLSSRAHKRHPCIEFNCQKKINVLYLNNPNVGYV